MIPSSKIERSWQLLTTGHLPGWAGWLLAALLGAAVCWQLQRELAAAPSRIVVRWLFALRAAVVALAVWLLCKPVLLVTDRWETRPALDTVELGRHSFGVRENFGGAHRGLDVAEALSGHATEGRVTGATAVGHALEQVAATLEAAARRAAAESEHLSSALPPRPEFTGALPVLRQALLAGREELARRQALLPAKLANDQLTATREAAAGRLRAVAGALQTLASEVDVVAKQGPAFPELIGKFGGKLEALAQEARRLAGDWNDLQAALDEAAAAVSPGLKAALPQPRTRQDFIDAANLRINELKVNPSHIAGGSDLFGALRRILSGEAPAPAAIVLLDDGTTPLTDADRAALRLVREAGVTVHAALVGADGLEPPDAGLIAVEVPGVAVMGRRFVARVLVKNGLPKGSTAKLVATAGETVLAQVAVKESGVLELPLRFDAEGRQSVRFEVQTGESDALPNNQAFATVIDVVARPLRVLVISDTMSPDFVLLRGVGERLPQLRIEAILLDPQLGKFSVGGEPGQFPATPEQWKEISAVVLLGSPTASLPADALAGLPAAIEAGLRVLVIPSGMDGGWLPSLGLGTLVAKPAPPAPHEDLWLPFYALGRDEAESLERWARLPVPGRCLAPVPAGEPLLKGEAESAMQLLVRGRGGILFAGLPSLSALRAEGNAATVNRLVAGLLETTARPWRESETGPLLFPPQPVNHRRQIADFGGARPADLEGAELQGSSLSAYGEEITFTHGGQKFRRPVHHLVGAGDFALTPHAGPLEEAARLGHGRFVQMVDFPELLNDLHLAPVECQDARSYRLWSGGWPLVVLLSLVSAEYLLRRRAGRVM
jgi:hypothetical protein